MRLSLLKEDLVLPPVEEMHILTMDLRKIIKMNATKTMEMRITAESGNSNRKITIRLRMSKGISILRAKPLKITVMHSFISKISSTKRP
jgi:hypothetical protein